MGRIFLEKEGRSSECLSILHQLNYRIFLLCYHLLKRLNQKENIGIHFVDVPSVNNSSLKLTTLHLILFVSIIQDDTRMLNMHLLVGHVVELSLETLHLVLMILTNLDVEKLTNTVR